MSTVEDIFPNITSDNKSESGQKIYATLQALTDLIQFKKAPIQPTSYFGLILTTLLENNYKPEQKPDLVKLFSIVLVRISHGIVRQQSLNIINIIGKILSEVNGSSIGDKDKFDLSKSSLEILGYILVVADTHSWQVQEYLRCYMTILELSVHSDKAKLRQKASEQIVLVLNSVGTQTKTGLHKTIADLTSKFCHEIFEKLTSETIPQSFYALTIVNELISLLPPSLISMLLDDLIKLTALGNSPLTQQCYRGIGSLFFKTNQLTGQHIQLLIEALFNYPPSGIDIQSIITYTELLTQSYLYLTKLDAKLCNQHVQRYFTILIKNFGSDNPMITRKTMDGFISVITECINQEMINQAISNSNSKSNNGNKSPLEIIIETLESGLKLTYKASWELILLVIGSLYEQLGPNAYPMLNGILINLDKLYSLQDGAYHQQLTQLFITVMLSIGPKNFFSILPLNLYLSANDKENRNWLLPLMKDNIRYTNLSFFQEFFIPMANELKVKAAQALSTEKLIESRNLEILQNQIWNLLPGFLNHPLDCEKSFKSIAKVLGSMISDDSNHRVIVCQSLSQMINKLKETEATEPLPFIPLKKSYHTMSQERAKECLQSISQFSKNYLPILFNIFPTALGGQKFHIINTIESFVSITDSVTLNSLFKNIVTKLLDALSNEGIENTENNKSIKQPAAQSKRYYLTDLTIGFVKFLDEENIQVLYKVIKPQLQCNDNTLQKKSFNILVKISEYHPNFIVQNMTKIKSILVNNLMKSPSNIKKTKLRCLKELILTLSKGEDKSTSGNGSSYNGIGGNDDEMNQDTDIMNQPHLPKKEKYKIKTGWTQLKTKFIPSILPEIILCTKEANYKTRECANDLLIEMAKVMCLIGEKLTVGKKGISIEECKRENKVLAFQEYIQLMSAGLASLTPMMVSASIVALARVIHEFKRYCQKDFIQPLISVILVLVSSSHREIVKSVFGFIRVIIATFKDPETIQPHLEKIITGLAKWGSEDKNYFRLIIQILLERLIKRFDFETVYEMVPEDFKKVLTNIRKRKERKEKLKQQQLEQDQEMGDVENDQEEENEQDLGDDDDNDDNGDIEEFLFNSKKKTRRAAETDQWIMGEGDNPIDFTDRNAINYLLTKPTTQSSNIFKKINNPFEIDQDGNMIIHTSDSEDERGGKKKQPKKKSFIDQVFDEEADEMDRKLNTKRAQKKRSLGEDSDDDDDYDDLSRENDDLKSTFSRKTNKSMQSNKSMKSMKSQKSTKSSMSNQSRIQTATERYQRVRGIDTNVNLDYSNKGKKNGDKKGTHKHEPYAYIKLDPKSLNKRSKQKSTDQFKAVLSKKRKK